MMTSSASSPPVTPLKLFGPNVYHAVSPLSQFSGLLPVFQALPVSADGPNRVEVTLQPIIYLLKKKLGRYLYSSRSLMLHKIGTP